MGSRLAREMVAELHTRDSATPMAVEGLAMALLATLRREGSLGVPAPGRWLDRVREYIDAHYLEPIRLRQLAELAGVHPAHLTRGSSAPSAPPRERTSGGCAWTGRATSSRRAPVASPRSLRRRAFADQSHLYRAVRAATGLVPSELRRVGRGAVE